MFRNKDKERKQSATSRIIKCNDKLITWFKSVNPPQWVDEETWNNFPGKMLNREITYFIETPGFRSSKIIILTSLIDDKIYTVEDIAELYRLRWRVELYFKDIKTSMKMKELHCKSPDMIQKELIMYFIAYNLIRILIANAAEKDNVAIDRLSFKTSNIILAKALHEIKANLNNPRKLKKLTTLILDLIVSAANLKRKPRTYHRVIKGRYRKYSLLLCPRNERIRESIKRSKRRLKKT